MEEWRKAIFALTSRSHPAHVALKSHSRCAHNVVKHFEKGWAHFRRLYRAHVALTSRSNGRKSRSNGEKSRSWRAMSALWSHSFFKRKILNFWVRSERSMSATFPQMSSPRAHYDRTKSATWARRERLKTSLEWGTTELSINCKNYE